MGIGKSREMAEFEDLEGDFHDLDQSDDERITFIIDRSIKTIIDPGREDTERITALEILGNVAYISDVRGVILIAQYLPFILALIDLKRQPSHATTCRVLGTVSQIGFEMGEVQEALFLMGGYETILSHLHNSCTPDRYMSQENEIISKWAAYCLCCCLGDVLEPLEYVKKEIKNAELRWLATTPWEHIWGRNWGLCLAKLLGKTKAFRKPVAESTEVGEADAVVDETKCVELDPSSVDPFVNQSLTSPSSDGSGNHPMKHSPPSQRKSPPTQHKKTVADVSVYDSYRPGRFDPTNSSRPPHSPRLSSNSDFGLKFEDLDLGNSGSTTLMPNDAVRPKGVLKPESRQSSEALVEKGASNTAPGEVKFEKA